MATYATDLSILTACDTATGWSELPSPHAAGAAPDLDEENYFHNAASVSQGTGQATGQGAGIQFDNGSALTWTTASNWVVMFWAYYAAPTNLLVWASGGLRLGVGSADNNAKMFNAMGNNFGKYPYGGWQNTAIDPEFSAVDQTIGTVGTGYQNFAVLPNITAKITKGSPLAVDILRYGRGELQVTGTSATFTGMATANDNATTARWGLFQSEGGSNFSWKGLMSLGLTGTLVTFSDSDKAIQLEDTPRVLAGFNKIEINHVDSSVTLTAVNISGRQTSITGSAPVSSGDFEVIDNATIDIDSCTFTDLGTFVFNSGTNSNTIDTTIFRRCKKVTQGSASFTGNTFDAPNVAVSTAGFSADDLDTITNCDFISSGTGHAVELTDLGDGSLIWDNTLSGYDAGVAGSPVTPTNTGDEAIWVNVGSGTVTIGISSTGTTPSIRSAGATVNIVANQVTVEINNVSEGTACIVIADETAGTITKGDVIFEKLADSGGIAKITDFVYEEAFNPSGLDVISRARSSGLPTAAIQDDNSSYIDETTNANSSTANDMNLLPTTPVVNEDGYIFGHAEKFEQLKIEVSTFGVGGFTITWQYWNGAGWSSLTGVVDGTSSFTASGKVSWTLPGSWTTTTINSQGPYYYIRAFFTAGTVSTVPKGRKCKLDVQKYLPFVQNRTISSNGLSVAASWNEDNIATF